MTCASCGHTLREHSGTGYSCQHQTPGNTTGVASCPCPQFCVPQSYYQWLEEAWNDACTASERTHP